MKKLLISTLLYVFVVATAYAEFTVRTIYFQPTDAPAVAPVEKIRNAMERTQKFYADEMEKHKFGRKTFRLERDNAGKVVVHTVKGRHKAQHYFNDTAGTLKAELPAAMKNKNDILLSFIGGLDGVAGGWNGQGGGWFGHDCGGCRGWAAVANKNDNFALSTVKHELGHTFGLYHNLAGKQGANFLMWFSGILDTYEARWLDKSRYFNDRAHIINPPPQIVSISRPKAMLKNNTDYVEFTTDIQGNQELYQAQIFRSSDQCVVDWHRLEGRRDTVDFQVKRTDLLGDFEVWVHVQDVQGNQSVLPLAFTLPPKKEPFKVTVEHKDPDILIKPEPEEAEPEPVIEIVEDEKPDTKPEPDPDLQVVARNKIILLWGALKSP